jgi:uncharacterized RDD family membrane protein YckC
MYGRVNGVTRPNPLTSVDAVADDAVMNVSFILLGAVSLLLGGAALVRPGLMIRFRTEWARLLTRPFMHGRVVGGEVDPEDPFQRLITRFIGVMFVIVGAGFIVGGIRGPN